MLNSIQCHTMAMLQYCEKGSCAWYNGSYEMQTLFLDYPVQTLKNASPTTRYTLYGSVLTAI